MTSDDECVQGSLIHYLGEPQNRTDEVTIAGLFESNAMNGTIATMLMPVADNTAGGMMADETRQQAMRFYMAQNVMWVMGGNWSLTGLNDTETVAILRPSLQR